MTEQKGRNSEDPGGRVRVFISGLAPGELNLYRLFVEQVRQLHADVWNGVRFFLTGNAIVVAAIGVVYTADFEAGHKRALIVGLGVLGLLFTSAGLLILRKHREYYLNGLARKTLLEQALGFHDVDAGPDLDVILPWSVPKSDVASLLGNPKRWLRGEKWRCGTISLVLLLCYALMFAVYIAILVAVRVVDIPGVQAP